MESRLKKIILIIGGIYSLMFVYPIAANEVPQEMWKVLPISHVYINNKEEIISEEMGTPYIDITGRAQLPLRLIGERMGYNVEWNPDTKEISIDNGRIKLRIGNNESIVNGIEKEMDTKPRMDNGRVYVPIRFVSEALECKVEYKVDGVINSIYIEKIQPTNNNQQKNSNNEEFIYLYGFSIPSKIINAEEKEIEETGLPVVNWENSWKYLGIHLSDGKAGLSDGSYKLENFLKLKYDMKTVQEIMDKFRKEDEFRVEFEDNTYIKFSRASDESRMILIGYK